MPPRSDRKPSFPIASHSLSLSTRIPTCPPHHPPPGPSLLQDPPPSPPLHTPGLDLAPLPPAVSASLSRVAHVTARHRLLQRTYTLFSGRTTTPRFVAACASVTVTATGAHRSRGSLPLARLPSRQRQPPPRTFKAGSTLCISRRLASHRWLAASAPSPPSQERVGVRGASSYNGLSDRETAHDAAVRCVTRAPKTRRTHHAQRTRPLSTITARFDFQSSRFNSSARNRPSRRDESSAPTAFPPRPG